MIYKLRRKMIWISCTSVIGVFVLIYILISVLSNRQFNRNMDMVTDLLSAGNGTFFSANHNLPKPPVNDHFPNFYTEETPFSTRFFTVWLDENDDVININVDSVSSITEEQAHQYAVQVLNAEKDRGWQDNFRYKKFKSEHSYGIVFVDGSQTQFILRTIMFIAGLVLFVSAAIILFLIILLSKRAVRPIAQSYEKQKQFITDANHELKTPLTLILTNLDIVELEMGHSEWIDDIRAEGEHMSSLINQLTALSRLDEDEIPISVSQFSFSDLCNDIISEFIPLIEKRGFTLDFKIESNVIYNGDEGAVRQLVAILLDNAIKYCDDKGNIHITLSVNRQIILSVENSCINIDQIELERLFDRFYRADKARTAGSGFGIGLSLAKSIVNRHGGQIYAYKAESKKIGFRVIMK